MNDTFEEYRALIEAMPSGLAGSIELLLREMEAGDAMALRLAAIPHNLDAEILGVLLPELQSHEIDRLCDELANLSFMNQIAGTTLMHDEVRGYLFDQWLLKDKGKDFRDISARLVNYFEAREGDHTTEQEVGAQLQAIFHQMGANPEAGFKAFEAFCRRERYRFRLHACETVIKLIHEYDSVLHHAHSLWLTYHEAKLAFDLRRYEDAETLFQKILAEPEIDAKLSVRCIYRMGNIHQARRDWRAAISAYNEGLSIVAGHPETQNQEVKILQGLSTALRKMGKFQEAGDVLKNSIMLAESQNDRSALAAGYNSLGNLHRKLGQFKRAIEAFEMSLTFLNRNDESFRPSQVYNNLGLIYIDLTEWETARDYLEQSSEIAKLAGDTNGQAIALSNLGRVYLNLSEQKHAIEVAVTAVELFQQIHNWYGAAATCAGLARFYRRSKQISEARAYFVRSVSLFKRANASNQALEIEAEIARLGQRERLPWYAVTAIVLFILIFVLIFIGLITA